MSKKQEAIDLALSKLSVEEQELLGLIKKPKVPKIKKNYKFIIDYMIGDANGSTSEEAIIKVTNPFIKIITEALDKLQVLQGHWAITLNDDTYYGNKENCYISELECELLSLVTYNLEYKDLIDEFLTTYNFEISDENYNYLQEFDDMLKDTSTYSFLCYKGYKLK